MNPTPEQVAQWAREAGDLADEKLGCKGEFHPDWHEVKEQFFATRACAWQAEQDAVLCESRATPGTGSVAILNGAADAIRANAPKLTKRCELCRYDHGHSIGCENNPVDIALKETP